MKFGTQRFRDLGQLSGSQPRMVLSSREQLTMSGIQSLDAKDASEHPVKLRIVAYNAELWIQNISVLKLGLPWATLYMVLSNPEILGFKQLARPSILFLCTDNPSLGEGDEGACVVLNHIYFVQHTTSVCPLHEVPVTLWPSLKALTMSKLNES